MPGFLFCPRQTKRKTIAAADICGIHLGMYVLTNEASAFVLKVFRLNDCQEVHLLLPPASNHDILEQMPMNCKSR